MSDCVRDSAPGDKDLNPAAEAFLQAMRDRYACKLFRQKEKLPANLRDFILECGRLSPSSFGLEHWKFVVCEIPGRDSGLFRACFDQEAVGTASLAVVILVRAAPHYAPDSDFIRQRSGRFPGGYEVFLDDYRGYHEFLEKEGRIESWAQSQAYIACTNMMTGAAAASIDSCAIEGFSEKEVLLAVGADASEWMVGLISVFGYRDEPVRLKIREDFSSVVEFTGGPR